MPECYGPLKAVREASEREGRDEFPREVPHAEQI